MARTFPDIVETEAGMSLLEVIVALLILSMGLAVLFNTVDLGTHTMSVAEQQRGAAMAAQSLLAELGRSQPIVDGTSEGRLPTGQHWQLAIQPLDTAPSAPTRLLGHEVHLTVSWPDGSQERQVEFDTLMLTAAP